MCVRSDIDFAALRAEPNIDGALLAEIPPGSCDVGLLDTNEVQGGGLGWYHVMWQGIEGWTAASNTTRTVTPPPASASSLGGPPTDWTVDTPSGVACPAPDVTPQDGWWAGFTDMRGGGAVALSGTPVQFSLRCDLQSTLRTMERAPGAPVWCVNYGSYASVPCPVVLQYMFLWIRIEDGVVAELVGAFVGE